MGYEKTDADMFAEWGIDMLKYDGCYSNDDQQKVGYPAMSHALNNTGRPIIYSCSWPAYQGEIIFRKKTLTPNIFEWFSYDLL